jgi:hypothetical protein
MGNLIFALERLHEKGLVSKQLHFHIGQKAKISTEKIETTVAVGQCAAIQKSADITIDQCPPTAGAIIHAVTSATL